VTTLVLDKAQTTNGAHDIIDLSIPYRVTVALEGVAPLLFHAWNNESVAEKAAAAKGSKAKKSDDVESYVYRDADGNLGIPGKNLHASIVVAGKSMPDPRSPRKSAMDLCRAGIVPLSIIAPFEPLTQRWDYEDKQRVTVQRAGVTRTRPAMREGWRATFTLLVNTPEYLNPQLVNQLIAQAGRLVGLCDFRPTYGRFAVVGYAVESEAL
jgi:hypothetical protein